MKGLAPAFAVILLWIASLVGLLEAAAIDEETTQERHAWTNNNEEKNVIVKHRRLFLDSVLPPNILAVKTNLVDFFIQLFPDIAPLTVDNFLNYVNNGDFSESIFHRFVPGFVLQSGAYNIQNGEITEIPTNEAVANEFQLSNTMGTIAMAKPNEDADGARSQWFINIEDNSATLDTFNGGFTVFARLVDVAFTLDRLTEALTPVDLGPNLGSVAAINPVGSDSSDVQVEDLLVIEWIQGSGLVNGLVFEDVNKNGLQDDGEPGLAGLVVYSDSNDNREWDTNEEIATATLADGSFSLRLNAGLHNIMCVATNPNTVVASETYIVVVAIGGEVTNVNFAAQWATPSPTTPSPISPTASPSYIATTVIPSTKMPSTNMPTEGEDSFDASVKGASSAAPNPLVCVTAFVVSLVVGPVTLKLLSTLS